MLAGRNWIARGCARVGITTVSSLRRHGDRTTTWVVRRHGGGRSRKHRQIPRRSSETARQYPVGRPRGPRETHAPLHARATRPVIVITIKEHERTASSGIDRNRRIVITV